MSDCLPAFCGIRGCITSLIGYIAQCCLQQYIAMLSNRNIDIPLAKLCPHEIRSGIDTWVPDWFQRTILTIRAKNAYCVYLHAWERVLLKGLGEDGVWKLHWTSHVYGYSIYPSIPLTVDYLLAQAWVCQLASTVLTTIWHTEVDVPLYCSVWKFPIACMFPLDSNHFLDIFVLCTCHCLQRSSIGMLKTVSSSRQALSIALASTVHYITVTVPAIDVERK